MNPSIRNFRFVAFVIIVCVGCGPQMVSVTGTVQREGQVHPGGTVLFRPLAPGLKPAVGEIQTDGTFDMMTEGPGDGVMIGRYRVVIAGQRDAKDRALRTTYLGPNEKAVDVVAGKENEIVINVKKAEGWEAMTAEIEETAE
jgi:hypothetical protein